MPILYHADAMDMLSGLPEDFFDSVVTDPPHEIGFMGKAWDKSGIAYSVPFWSLVLRVLRPGCVLLAKGNVKTYHRMVCAIEDAGFIVEDMVTRLNGNNNPKSRGRLKNAQEPIAMAMKPGPALCLQIEASRIPVSDTSYRQKCESVIGLDSNTNGSCYGEWAGQRTNSFSEAGRWPANVIIDEMVAEDLGEVARYFYCPRASASERGDIRHPTLTPLALCTYLLRLVTPEKGRTLDPFMGSGSFVLAAHRLGFEAWGIEKDAQNYAEALKRTQSERTTP